MDPNTGIMNIVLRTFLDKISIGVGVVGVDARGLLGILALMELILISLWWAYSGNEALSKLIKKVLAIFFFIWVIDNYSYILTWITNGFVWTGQRAAGGAAVDIDDPSGIMFSGFEVVTPILEHARAQSSLWGGGFFDALMSLISAFFILVAYFILAVQIFLVRIEFALISTLGLILVPFGVFKYTAFMAEKVFGAVISFGVKLMVLAFVIAVGFPLMETLSLPPDPSWPEMLSIMFGALAMAVLAIHAPGVAAGLLSGGPSLTAGSAGGATMAAGALGVGTVMAGAGGIMAVRGALGTASYGLGKLKSGGAKKGSEAASSKGTGNGFQSSSFESSAGLGGALNGVAPQGKEQGKESTKETSSQSENFKGFESNNESEDKEGFKTEKTKESSFKSNGARGNFSDKKSNNYKRSRFSTATQAASTATNNLNSSQPIGGTEARINRDDKE